MSRAFRIKVQQRLQRVIKASDHVSTELELLDILPADQTCELLTDELKKRGFEEKGNKLVRREAGTVIQIDPKSAQVLVRTESQENVDLEANKTVIADADAGKNLTLNARREAEKALKKELESKADSTKAKLQQQVTEKLEGRLLDLQKELNQVVNKVTAESLKRRAAQIGNIKEVSEDPHSGSLKIVVEV